ncbi:MAG: zinc protease [Bacteroidota bacterium]|nr:zinc protease [Bacteroidota bacterium]
MLKYFLLFFLGAVLMISFAVSKGSAKVFPYEYKSEKLPNGLTVIMVPMPVKGIVSYFTVVRTGSRDEFEKGHTGFAHFFEHMMFRGTKKYPGRVYDSLITSLGSNANAYTTDDYTCYHLNLSTEDLDKIMEFESDRFQNLFYEEPDFQTEAGAVYGELRKTKTEPFFWLEEKIAGTAFTVHPYSHTTMGFEKDVAAMPTMYDYSREFFKKYYRPENCVILVTGDFRQEDLMNKVKKYYGAWQPGYVTPAIPIEPEQTKERIAEVKYPGKTLPLLAVGYKGAAYNPKDKNLVAAYLLGEIAFGSTSNISKKLYIQEQKVNFITTEFQQNKDPNILLVLSMIKDQKDIDYVKKEIFNTIDYYQKNPVDPKKLDDLKKRQKYAYLMKLDTPEKTASALARTIALTGGISAVDEYFETLELITPQDILNAAKKFFTPEKRTVVTLKGGK